MNFEYWTAFDPTINRRTVHVKQGEYLISLVSGHRFKQDVTK